MSKGSKPRPFDWDKYSAGHERIFSKDEPPALEWGSVAKTLETALVQIAGYNGMAKLTRADCAHIARKALEDGS